MPHTRDTRVDAPEVGTLAARITARLCADRLDGELSLGFFGAPGSAAALHAARLESDRERRCIVRALDGIVTGAGRGRRIAHVPVHAANVRASEQTINEVVARLRAPRAVSARGVARLRRVLSDGAGPLYLTGVGDLEGRLRAALAAL
ncbi:hypothetical protein [Mycolicibacterium diernhoferi]|uniref:Uncharacterized protein n=1 Tax=Mycolicibacterium diernhoferi TaxID=1801 RepID=A0A1Q4HJ29_9MYCO|nr:hypothetical protein [Mycolicibacterium diernhoferi]OJZ67549.1 hypothetical protein BRW64_04570 [Mycolicibacterium diernhoferi]OPE53640.1 hypothetical protein BV510_14515 [Mycolicibacterium diernhoferi]PEG55819.1 hypothetical protein CRI78_04140 [Mycolicibacterium diernhoferi]QYL25199.1 hypothetical protein K0O62_13705 [Mycolicibacterium diernhoferi]